MLKRIVSILSALLMTVGGIPLAAAASQENSAPLVIPAIRDWQGTNGKFIPDNSTVLVNKASSYSVEKVAVFFSDYLGLSVSLSFENKSENAIIFELDESLLSSVGEEGYKIIADESIITVSAPTDKGLLYGGITVAQSVHASGFFPCGTAIDYPAYSTRSGMIDVGRAWIPLDYVEEITKYMAWFKLNEVHLHINDDSTNNYSAFRLESNVAGLSAKDGCYTKDEYRAYQKRMLEYGIAVVTEIDTPFHSGCYQSADNPPPHLPENNRCLDISKPETLEFVKNLFDEYITGEDPVFVNKVVHIGTDEYPREYSEDMRAYTNALIEHINSRGYTPRFWAGFGPNGFQGDTPISEKAQINFWDIGISGINEVLASNYEVVNTVNMILYTVPTTNYDFPDYYDLEKLYTMWQVHMFDLAGEAKMDPNDERLLGACFALWNDLQGSKIGVTRHDIFDRLRGMTCLISEKTWCGLDTASMSVNGFLDRFERLSLRSGDSDPGRHEIPAEEIVIDFENGVLPEYVTQNGGKLENGELLLDGQTSLSLPIKALGFPNTLEFELRLDELPTSPLFSGDGIAIYADADGSGKFGFKTEEYTFTYDYKIPLGDKVKLCLTSNGKHTVLIVNDEFCYDPYNSLNPSGTRLVSLTVPLETIGLGVKGAIDNIKVTTTALEPEKLIVNRNIALNAEATVSGLEVNDGRFTPDLALDGIERSRVSFARDKDEQWMLVDLGGVYSVSRIEIMFQEHVSEYEIMLSENGTDFVSAYKLTGGEERVSVTDTINLNEPINARYVKYVQLKRWYHSEWNTHYSGGICEFRVFSSDMERYEKLVLTAQNALSTISKDDPRRSDIRTSVNELSRYLDSVNVYRPNAEALYNKLNEILNAPEPEASRPEEESNVSEPESGDNELLVPLLGGLAAGVAIAATAFIIIKKRKNKNG
ncbi:MAG: family 20 glycosylhydrolase [Clostridia bacterium]|nr:family 20 glycosylhydrolase [Clostridia bacterium]